MRFTRSCAPWVVAWGVCAAGSLAIGADETAKTASDVGPETIIAMAIEAQNGAAYSYVRDFEVMLTMSDTHPERGRIQFDVDCKFKMPDRILTDIDEPDLSGKKFVEGYDGKIAWYRDDKGVKLYEGRDFAEDRKKLQETSATMHQLLRFFFLGNLTRDLTDVHRLPDESYTDSRSGVTTHAYVVQGMGRRPDGDREENQITLWVDQQSNNLLGVLLSPVADPANTINFCFTKHDKNPQGVVVPGKIQIYHQGRAEPSQEIVILRKDGENQIRFNVSLKDSLFAPPTS